MEQIITRYKETIERMVRLSQGSPAVDKGHVFLEGNPAIRTLIDSMIQENIEDGSGLRNASHIFELHRLARDGRAVLILSEHYSNADLPVLIYFLSRLGDEGRAAAEAIVAIAGIKLHEENPLIRALTGAYTRIVIYPSRYLEIIRTKIKEPRELVHEVLKSNSINRAAMKSLARVKAEGKMVLVYPAGTRFRPWDPGSKRGVREIDSYIKTFDFMILISINGNILRINPAGEMSEDLIVRDKLVMTASPIIACREFRAAIKDEAGFREDKKQLVVDEVMRRLDNLHRGAEKAREGSSSVTWRS
ncbi:MAG: 1-acyl-sn-glycerol-3-phosphate acyltransferase [Candidatus Aminicenantales bacterium]